MDSLNWGRLMRIAAAPLNRLLLASFPCNYKFLNRSIHCYYPIKIFPAKTLVRFRDCSISAGKLTPPMSASPSPPVVQVKDTIQLTDKERLIFDRLLQVLRHFNLTTELRVAGGWVRDKLLGKESCDIDIALDNMLGRAFCEKVNEYLISTGEETHGVGVIQCNPDQSKHLETATMRLYDMWIDFVNLRCEDYCEDSRIPEMSFGTAEEDAKRRDLTINSLFYNINTSSVEDFTGKGIEHLKSGKIVTPLPPRKTFLDDPLRVLRAIRFGARFDFILDEGLKEAASSDDVKNAMAEKISRERIGHEIDLMVAGNQPVKAMSYLSTLQLFWVVFNPPNTNPPIPDKHDRLCVAYMDAAWKLLQSRGFSFNGEQKKLSLYAALFLPLRQTVYIDNKSKEIPVVSYIFRNSLKLKSSDAETVVRLHGAAKKFLSLFPCIISNEEKIGEVYWKREIIDVPAASKLRILTGLLLREIKDFWRVALLLSTLLYYDEVDITSSSFEHDVLDRRRQLFNQVEEAVTTQGLDNVWAAKPLVNGNEIMSILHLQKGGPLVREWVEKLLQWQLAYPSGSAEDCIEWMKEAQSKRARTE